MAKSPNRLLASLPSDVFSALAPHLKTIELKFGDVLAKAGSPIRQVYFPYSGVISLVVELDIGSMIETAMVGHDGALNAASALEMSALGQKQTCALQGPMSALPPKATSNATYGMSAKGQ